MCNFPLFPPFRQRWNLRWDPHPAPTNCELTTLVTVARLRRTGQPCHRVPTSMRRWLPRNRSHLRWTLIPGPGTEKARKVSGRVLPRMHQHVHSVCIYAKQAQSWPVRCLHSTETRTSLERVGVRSRLVMLAFAMRCLGRHVRFWCSST